MAIKIEYLKEEIPVYDITVEDNHNFYANNVLVHNCGEQTLAPGGVCNLGSMNLTQFLKKDRTGFDFAKLKKYVPSVVRFLDNINDLSHAPLEDYEIFMKTKRRIGVGILGWASALYLMKTRIGSQKANEIREELMRTLSNAVVEASVDLAEEKGMFSECIPEKHAEAAYFKQIGVSSKVLDRMRKVGIRNSSLMSIQPTGNTSIVANIVSGGLEPIFLQEYVRTVIVPQVPDHLKDVTPKFHEGHFEPTSFFKITKEGDETILRGVDKDGTVYKIDRNRGLTKEVVCTDYAVRKLKETGEWDPKADWAVTTANMSVEDHISDLKGFSKYIDSAVSKTVNLPNNYTFDNFKKVYIDAYNTGYIKGLTTYRAGTMTVVLSAKEEKFADNTDEEIIKDEVKLPDSSPAVMKVLRAESRKWYLTVILNDDQTRPMALFVHTNAVEKNVTTNDAVDRLLALAARKKIPKKHITSTEEKIAHENNVSKIARVISLLLRHGVLIKNIISELDKMETIFVGSFLFQIKKYLSSFIKDGEKVEGAVCQDCGSDKIVFSEGCSKCTSCGSSKCG